MKHGIFVAPFGELSDPKLLAELARDAEAQGFDGFFLWDHVRYREVDDVSDAWIALAAIACATERLTLGPLVTPPARRRPWILHRQVVTLDHLSGGRAILGLGLGGDNSGELSGFGEQTDPKVRGAMLDEALDVIELCASGEPVKFDGEHYTLDTGPMLPRAVQSPRVPIWLAARWPNRKPVRRAAKYDGLFPIELEAEQLAELLSEIETGPGFDVVVTGQHGRDPEPWERAGATWFLDGWGHHPKLADVREAIAAGP